MVEVLYRDEFLVAVYKPAGILALPERQGSCGDDVLAWLQKHIHPKAQLLHRLDRPTSGILLATWDPLVFRQIYAQFANHTVEKKYWALVHGAVQFERAELQVPISPQKRRADPFSGKPALTLAQTIEAFRQHTLVLCRPITGRPHQVRIHLAYYGYPIVNDTRHGGQPLYLSQVHLRYKPDKRYPERPLHPPDVIFLHAGSLAFAHPGLGKTLTLEGKAPKHFEVALRQLRRYSAVSS